MDANPNLGLMVATPDAQAIQPVVTAAEPAPASSLDGVYDLRRRAGYAIAAVLGGVLVAGFWNYKLVDGFGRQVVAGHTIGDTHALAGTFGLRGIAFGFLFALIAGIATTFTACNCVVFAMLPGLTCSADRRQDRWAVLRPLSGFLIGVISVGVVYGLLVGSLGADGAAQFNAFRKVQAQVVFTVLGTMLLVWGAIEFGFLDRIGRRLPEEWRETLANPSTKATLMGLVVGAFAVGRPYPVFRDLLTYAASSHDPLYGAGVMALQGIAQVSVMLLLVLLIVLGPWRLHLLRWVSRPGRTTLVTATAMVAGGSYFIFYWGLFLLFSIGGWGFRLGLYH